MKETYSYELICIRTGDSVTKVHSSELSLSSVAQDIVFTAIYLVTQQEYQIYSAIIYPGPFQDMLTHQNYSKEK